MSESDIQKICSTQYDSLLTSGLFAFIKQIIITEIWSKALVVLSWGHKLHVYVARQKDLRAQIREGFKYRARTNVTFRCIVFRPRRINNNYWITA